MATQPKVNPVLPNVARHFNGKSVTAVSISLGDVTAPDFDAGTPGDFGPDGAVQAVYEVLAENATPIIISEITPTGGNFDVYFEGDFQEIADYALGNNTFVGDLEARIQALGTIGTVALGSATVSQFGGLVDDTTGTAGLVGDGGVDIS